MRTFWNENKDLIYRAFAIAGGKAIVLAILGYVF